MFKFIVKRILSMIPIFIGVAFVVFFIMELSPGDPAVMMLGENATPEQIKQFTELHHLDKPFLWRFGDYLLGVFTRADFGASWLTSKPVVQSLRERLPITLTITVSSIAFASIIGVTLGILSAVKQYSGLDYILFFP